MFGGRVEYREVKKVLAYVYPYDWPGGRRHDRSTQRARIGSCDDHAGPSYCGACGGAAEIGAVVGAA